MGVYNVVEMTYKKGLLKKLFEEEEKKQYIDSQIDDGKSHKGTEFCRGSGYRYWYDESSKDYDSDAENNEHKYIIKYRFHIKTSDYPSKRSSKRYPKGYNSYGHQFIFYPENRKLYIYNVGGRYNWGKEDDHCKGLIKYFSNILEKIYPRTKQWEDFYSTEWSVRVTGDDCICIDNDDIDEYGDELTEDEMIFEIPEKLRTSLEQSRMVALFGDMNLNKDDPITLEEAVFKGKYDDIEELIKNEQDKSKLQELFYATCKHKYTNCVDLFIKRGIKPDNIALTISVKNNDFNTIKLLLISNDELSPYADDIADAAYSWKNNESQRDLFSLILDYYIKRTEIRERLWKEELTKLH